MPVTPAAPRACCVNAASPTAKWDRWTDTAVALPGELVTPFADLSV
ncbi:hypothetical protein [Winogradskya humida]|nr:hypothetical protein [Actinoplanes humidus]